MLKKKIDINIPEIKTIYHIADIHIRNLKRHDEYLLVFKRLKTEIEKDLDGALIYVGGDIVHAKTEMSPELVDMTVLFLRMLGDMAPTIIIAGNHDCNLNNRNRLDAILPIINALEHPNIHYLREAGIYTIANIDFAVFSRLNDISEWPKIKDCTSPVKIALYHGIVHGAISDTGFKLNNDKVKITRFNKYDLGLFGDIHKHQFLNSSKSIAYCGSLIQQNHGEDYYNHGMLKWDIRTKTAKFIRIENDYGFYTLRIRNGIILNDVNLPKKPRLRLEIENTPISDIQKIITEVRKKYDVQDVVISNIDNLKVKNNFEQEETNSIIGNIHDVAYQNELIVDYLTRTYNQLTDDLITEIKEINNKINSQIDTSEKQKGVTWKLKRLEFSNMFSYGENNVIDFTNMQGVYGLFSPNATGKSSILDVLLFVLFDRCSRALKAIDVLNKNKTWFTCKLQFELNGVDYFIEKKGKIEYAGNVAHCPVTINFWKAENGVIESLNGEQRRDTNNNIQQYIGTYENFVLTAMSLQNDNTGFINMTQSGRKDLLAGFLGLDIYEKLWQIAKEDIKEVEILLREFKKQDFTIELANLDTEINDKKIIYKKKNDELNKKQEFKDKIDSAILVFTKEIKDVESGNLNIDELNKNKIKYEKEINNIQNKITEVEKLMTDLEIEGTTLLEEYKKYDLNDLQKRKDLLQLKEEERNKLTINIERLKIDLKHKADKLEKLKNLEYNKDCKYCMNNIFVKDAIQTKEQFEFEQGLLDKMQAELLDINATITSMSIVDTEFNRFKSLESELETLKTSYIKAKSEHSALKSNYSLQSRYLDEVKNNIELYFKNQEIIERNLDYQTKIKKLEDEKINVSTEIKQLQSEIQQLHSEIQILENRRSGILESLNKIRVLERRFKAYEMYLSCVSRDGIPYELISKIIPIFETRVNNILTRITDFNILLNLDNKNIDAYIVYGNDKVWSLTLTSGMEKFISSIALRVALNSISNIPKPNCLFVDEGFGNLDADNVANMTLLFNYLKTHYDFLIVISHLDVMRDMTDNIIELKRIDGYSKVDY